MKHGIAGACGLLALLAVGTAAGLPEDWPQWKYDSRHSGHAPDRDVTLPLGLVGAVPLADAVFTSPAVVGGRVYVVDGSGVAWCLHADPVEGKNNHVWCLDARDGSLIWKSEPVSRAIHVITIGERFLFTHAQYQHGYLIDKETGKIVSTLTPGYRCTRFTLCEPYLLGPNLEMFDLSRPNDVQVVSSGPAVDLLICLGAIVSNGRVFHTTNGTGLQCSAVCGAEATGRRPPWQTR